IENVRGIYTVVALIVLRSLSITSQVIVKRAFEAMLLTVEFPLALVDCTCEAESLLIFRRIDVFQRLTQNFQRPIKTRVGLQVWIFVGAERGLLVYLEPQLRIIIEARLKARARQQATCQPELFLYFQFLGEPEHFARLQTLSAQNVASNRNVGAFRPQLCRPENACRRFLAIRHLRALETLVLQSLQPDTRLYVIALFFLQVGSALDQVTPCGLKTAVARQGTLILAIPVPLFHVRAKLLPPHKEAAVLFYPLL